VAETANEKALLSMSSHRASLARILPIQQETFRAGANNLNTSKKHGRYLGSRRRDIAELASKPG
jgi:hypothetical protein